MKPYDDFFALSELMLASAKRGDWIQLAVAEKRRSRLESVLKKDKREKQSLESRDKARRSIQRIMALDQETRRCIESRMTSLKKKAHTERKLVETYGMASIS